MKKAIAVIFIVLTWVVLCASLEADDLLIRFDADGQKKLSSFLTILITAGRFGR